MSIVTILLVEDSVAVKVPVVAAFTKESIAAAKILQRIVTTIEIIYFYVIWVSSLFYDAQKMVITIFQNIIPLLT
jgi:hypothetical protein